MIDRKKHTYLKVRDQGDDQNNVLIRGRDDGAWDDQEVLLAQRADRVLPGKARANQVTPAGRRALRISWARRERLPRGPSCWIQGERDSAVLCD